MKNKPLFLALLAGLTVSGGAQAALHDRGGGLLYDDVLNITWLQDANYAKTSGYSTGYWYTWGESCNEGGCWTNETWVEGGRMSWFEATDWAANLSYYDSVRGVTYGDWRLPTLLDTGTLGCNYANSGTDCGYNVPTYDSRTGTAYNELAYMYYVNLGLKAYKNPDGSKRSDWGILGNGTYQTEADVGLVKNLQTEYWSREEYPPYFLDAWSFVMSYGLQDYYSKNGAIFAWAVRPGDVAAVPEADTWAMLLAGLGLVGVAARRRRG